MKQFKELREAIGREITINWDMDDPGEHAADWQDQGVYLDDWDERKMEIEFGQCRALRNMKQIEKIESKMEKEF